MKFLIYLIRKYPSVTLFNCENNHDCLITDFINEVIPGPQAKKFTLKVDIAIHAMEYPRLPHHKMDSIWMKGTQELV